MALVERFCATRFCDTRDLGLLTAPPFDVLDRAQITHYQSKSDYNITYLSKNAKTEAPTQDRYNHLPKILKRWHDQGVLKKDSQPSLYYHEHTFKWMGQAFERKGFFAMIDLSKGVSRILPHERTIASHVQDRLDLMRQTDIFLSPIFLIAQDPNQHLYQALSQFTPPDPASFETLGADQHVFASLSNKAHEQTLIDHCLSHDLLLADGHHRFEMAKHYAQERNQATRVLAYITSSRDPGLLLTSIHRGLKINIEMSKWLLQAQHMFKCYPLSKRQFDQSGTPFAYVDHGQNKMYLYSIDSDSNYPTEIFQKAIIDPIQDLDPQLTYFKDAGHLKDFALSDPHHLTFWLKPLVIDNVFETCKKQKTLPPKSTYFLPKVLDGLVMCETLKKSNKAAAI